MLFLVFLVFAFFVPCGMTSYDLTPRVSEAVTASASLAVIKTASKHLHNDLARAIEALEQKKSAYSLELCWGRSLLPVMPVSATRSSSSGGRVWGCHVLEQLHQYRMVTLCCQGLKDFLKEAFWIFNQPLRFSKGSVKHDGN